MFLLQDPFRKTPSAFIRLRGSVDSPAVFAKLRFSLLEQAARRNSAQQLRIVRRARSPELGNVPSDARANGDGPLQAGGRTPRGSRRIPKSRYANVFRVP